VGGILIRQAGRSDVEPVVRMIADDQLGATRDSPGDLAPYLRAFEAIEADPNQFLAVADDEGRTVGTLQLTIIPGLARRGALRGQIEAVRVHAGYRGTGLGTTLLRRSSPMWLSER
jgi:GNAT superfamily N-acetyltransferase